MTPTRSMPEQRTKPPLLVLTKLAPWRLNGGALIRNYWLIMALAEAYAVDLFVADDAPDAPPEFAERLARIVQFPRPLGIAGKLGRAADALRPAQPIYAAGSVPPAMVQAVRAACADRGYVAVQFDLNMAAALGPDITIPRIYNAHNCEYALQVRRAQAERETAKNMSSRIVAEIIARDAGRLGVLETRMLAESIAVAACSQADLDDFAELLELHAAGAGYPIAPLREHFARVSAIIPNGVDTAAYADIPHAPAQTRTMLITGSMDWRPNRVGLQWFLDQILPELRRAASGQEFSIRIAGRMNEKLVRELAAYPEITAVANPRRMQDELARAALVVAPITASSGTRLRILEAWAAGRTVVTTSHGALGLDYTPEREILVRDAPDAFARTILEGFNDPQRLATIGEAARLRVRQYDWRPIGTRYLHQLAGVLPTALSSTA